jgi:hypothetical protein
VQAEGTGVEGVAGQLGVAGPHHGPLAARAHATPPFDGFQHRDEPAVPVAAGASGAGLGPAGHRLRHCRNRHRQPAGRRHAHRTDQADLGVDVGVEQLVQFVGYVSHPVGVGPLFGAGGQGDLGQFGGVVRQAAAVRAGRLGQEPVPGDRQRFQVHVQHRSVGQRRLAAAPGRQDRRVGHEGGGGVAAQPGQPR